MKHYFINSLSMSLLFFSSCGETQESTEETSAVENSMTTESEVAETPTEKKTTVIGNLEIYYQDNPEQTSWFKSGEACKELGPGWRMPTIEEMHLIWENRELIGGFEDDYGVYWSSTPNENIATEVWTLAWNDGKQYNNGKSSYNFRCRAVRDI